MTTNSSQLPAIFLLSQNQFSLKTKISKEYKVKKSKQLNAFPQIQNQAFQLLHTILI